MLSRHETHEFRDFADQIPGFRDLEIGISGSVRIRGDPEMTHFGPLFGPLLEGIIMGMDGILYEPRILLPWLPTHPQEGSQIG